MNKQTNRHPRIMFAISAILGVFLFFPSADSQAATTISLFPNGSFCASAFPTAYQAGSFSITETSINNRNGFSRGQTSKTLILGFSGGSFQFNPGVGTVTITGTEVTIVSYSITATNITVTLTTAATNTQFNTLQFNNIEVRATAAGVGKIVRSGGTFRIDNRTNRPSAATSWGALTTATPVTYSSSTSTQAVVTSVFSGSTDNQIIGMQVVVTGTCNNLSITQFNLSTTGSTNPTADIASAKIYYTGTSNAFATGTLFGSQATPNGAFVINGSVTLTTAGTYYFWLTYNITPVGTSINGDVLDAQVASIVVGGAAKVPTVTNPAGTRTISNNIYYSIAPGLWNNTTTVWSRTSGGPTCSCAPTLGNGLVFVNHAVSVNVSSTVDLVTVQTGGVLTNTAGSVLTLTGPFNTTGTGNFTISNNAWVLNDVTLAGTGTSKSSVTQTIGGTLNVGSGTTFQMTAASGTTVTVNGNVKVDGTLSLSGNNMTASNAAGTQFNGIGSITGTGTITLGVSKLASAATNLTVAPVVSISGGATFTNQGTVNMTNNVSGAGTWFNDVNSNLNMGGTTSAITATLTATATGNTVAYNGSGVQTVVGTTYDNVTAAGSNTKTLGAATIVNNTLTISGSAQLAAAALALSVDNAWINNSANGTPFSSTGTVTFTGNSTITGTAINTFNHLAISAAGSLTSHPTPGKMIITGNWTNDGDFDNNDSDITFSGNSTIAGASITIFNDVIVSATKSLTLPAGGEVDMEGDLTADGTVTPSTSLIVFAGIGVAQNIKGAAASATFYQFEIDNPAGAVQLQKPTTITNAFTLTNGFVNTSATNSLTLNNAVTITGGSSGAFVNGPLIEVSTGNNTVKTFPIGKSSDYRPVTLTITASGGPTSNYTVELFNASAGALNYTLPVGVDRVSGAHYWTISQSNAAGFTNATAQLSYDVNDQVSDPTHLIIAKNVGAGTTWFNVGGSGSAAPTGTITSNTFTTFGTFTLGNNGGSNTLPIELVTFEAVANFGAVDLNWVTASELDNDYFTVEKTKDGQTFEEVVKVPGAGNSKTALHYHAVDSQPYAGTSYYRLKQTDNDGAFKYSTLVMVSYSGQFSFSIYPNPMTGSSVNVRITGNVNDQVALSLKDGMGNQVYSVVFVLQNENDELTIDNLAGLSPGIYILSASNSQATNYQRVVIP